MGIESWIAPVSFHHDSSVVVYHLGENEVGRSYDRSPMGWEELV